VACAWQSGWWRAGLQPERGGLKAGVRAELRLAEQSGEEEFGRGGGRADSSAACGQLSRAEACAWGLGRATQVEAGRCGGPGVRARGG
jgi:hypothetical protein